MPLYLPVIMLFILGAVVIGYLQRDNYLEKLPLEPGEWILFEDEHAKFKAQSGRGRWTVYPWAFIRVTNRRILFAQGGFFGKKHVLRFIVSYVGPNPHQGEDASPSSILKSGREQWETDRDHILMDREKEKTIIRIRPSSEQTEWFQTTEVILYSRQPELYAAHLLKNSGLRKSTPQ